MADLHPISAPWWRTVLAGIAVGAIIGLLVRLLGITRRWEWWTDSPNDLAAILAAAVPLLIGILARWGWRPRAPLRWWVAAPCALGVITAIVGLVGSCSRGGVLAVVVACVMLAWLVAGSARRLAVLAILALAVAVTAAPRANARMTISPSQDPSIATRLSLMSASAMMLADRPAGWGAHQFGDICERWYLDRAREVRLWHPLNDVLWIGTERGLIAMGAFLVLSLALIAGLAQAGRSGDPLAAGFAASGAAFLVAGCATGLLRPGGISLTMAGFAIAAIGYWASRIRFVTTTEWRWTAIGGCAGVIATAAWWGVGTYLAATWPYQPSTASALAAAPRRAPTAYPVAVIQSSDDSPTTICRQVLRPLIDQGFAAICLDETALATWPGRTVPHIVLVLRGAIKDQSASGLIQAGTRGVVFLDLRANALPSIAPACPTLLVTGTAETPVSPPEWERLSKTHTQNRSIAAPVPFCWPRHFRKLSETVIRWMREVAEPAQKSVE